MKNTHLARQSGLILALLLLVAPSAHAGWFNWFFDGRQINSDEVVTFFPSHGLYDETTNRWTLTVEGWIYEPDTSDVMYNIVTDGYELIAGEDIADEDDFWRRIQGMVADNEGDETVKIRLGGKTYTLPASNDGGRISARLSLSSNEVARLDVDRFGWTSYTATSTDNRTFRGEIRLLPPTGLSVISDIDDTVKVSEVYKGNTTLLKNTFNRAAVTTPGIVDFYNELADDGASFHYLSGSPWQLFDFLNDFVCYSGLPTGTMRLKEFQVNPTSPRFWKFIEHDSTVPHKEAYIRTLLEDYPTRDFILIGDAGEKDPDIYAWAAANYPDQIAAVYIRHVPNKDAGLQTMDEIAAKFGDRRDLVRFIAPETGEILVP